MALFFLILTVLACSDEYGIYKPIKNINITGGVVSEGDPSMKTATQTTSVPLYTGMAGMVRVSTNVPSLLLR